MIFIFKFNPKKNVMPNVLLSVISCFIDSFQFLSSSLDSSVKNLSKDDFKYLSQEFHNSVLDLVKQKGFYPCEYMSHFEKFKEELPSKEKFYRSLTDRKISDKEYEYVLNVWKKCEMETMKDYHNLYLKFNVLLSADVFKGFRNNSFKMIMDYVQVGIWEYKV